MVDRWSGSIEAGEEVAVCGWMLEALACGVDSDFPCLLLGVTAIRPEDLEFPNTMTDIDYDTWMLRSGPAWRG